jgi:excisionase family DNA binding protein
MPNETICFEPILTAVEAGHLLGLHPVTLLRWAREKRIPHRKLGRKVTFSRFRTQFLVRKPYTDRAVRVAQP